MTFLFETTAEVKVVLFDASGAPVDPCIKRFLVGTSTNKDVNLGNISLLKPNQGTCDSFEVPAGSKVGIFVPIAGRNSLSKILHVRRRERAVVELRLP